MQPTMPAPPDSPQARGTSASSKPMGRSNRLLIAVRYLWGDEGISTQLIEVVRYLRSHGWRVGLIWSVPPAESAGSDNLAWLAEHTDTFYAPFPEPRLTFQSFRRAIRSIGALRDALLAFQPSVIHLHSLSLSPFFFLLRKTAKCPIAATAHIEPDPNRIDVRLSSIITKFFPSYLGDYFVATSVKMEEAYLNYLNLPISKTCIIHYGIDTDRFRPPTSEEFRTARAAFGLALDERVLCLVGRLDPIKGHPVLFRALSELSQNGLEVRAICAGEGGFKEEIKSRAKSLGVDHLVLFPGFCDPQTVYWASNVNVLPSFREGFALVIAEGMLAGVVPVRTPAAGVQDQIRDGENGFVVPFDDSSALAQRIADLFSDEQRRHRMGRAARRFAAERFGREQSLGRLLDFYQKIQSSASHTFY